MAAPKTENKFLIIGKWLVSSWAAVISIIITVLGTFAGGGYWMGCYMTKSDYNNTIMNMRIDHQKEISDAKDKAREDAISEMKEKQLEMEKLYDIMKGGIKR